MKNKGTITLDWGAIFDILSIYNVKINKCEGLKKEANIRNFNELAIEIKNQIGNLLFNEIIDSVEYIDLYNANLDTFVKIAEVQNTIGLAKDVDSLNYARFLKKNMLQQKFFNTEVTEIKVGYE
jgi:hypothetical protein